MSVEPQESVDGRNAEFNRAWRTPDRSTNATQMAINVDHPAFRGANAYPEYPTEWVHKDTGERQPIQHGYRAMSKEEYGQASERGYIRSDERNNLFPGHEGTNASPRPDTAEGYLRHAKDLKEGGVVVKMQIHPDDNWFASTDGNLRTRSKIPMSRVISTKQFGDLT